MTLLAIPPSAIAALLLIAVAVIAARRRDATFAIDALCVLLYARYPVPATLALIGVQALVRRVPTLAQQVCAVFRVDQAQGWTASTLLFVLPGLRVFDERRTTDTPPVAHPGAPGAPALSAAPLHSGQWLSYINGQPDRVPHCAIIGPSGAGKTTLATAALAERAGRIAVITAKEGDSWGGLPYVGIDEDATYTTAQATMTALLTEVKQRLVAVKQRQPITEFLNIVIDDFSTLKNECTAAPELVKLVARLGRSLKVRLIMLSDSALVKAIGLEGEGETRSNFAFIRLARGHAGTLELDDATRPIDVSQVLALAMRAQLAGRTWLAPAVCLCADSGDFGLQTTQTNKQTDTQTASQRDRLALALMKEGMKREALRRALQTAGFGFDDQQYTRWREQLEEQHGNPQVAGA